MTYWCCRHVVGRRNSRWSSSRPYHSSRSYFERRSCEVLGRGTSCSCRYSRVERPDTRRVAVTATVRLTSTPLPPPPGRSSSLATRGRWGRAVLNDSLPSAASSVRPCWNTRQNSHCSLLKILQWSLRRSTINCSSIILLLLCGPPNRPHYASCSSVRLSVRLSGTNS